MVNIFSKKLHFCFLRQGVMLVFSITSKKSFTLIEQLKSDIEKVRGKDVGFLLLSFHSTNSSLCLLSINENEFKSELESYLVSDSYPWKQS